MKKTVLSLVLILSIILTRFSCYASVICDTPAEVLYNLDIIPEIRHEEEYITRSECIMMASCMIDRPTLDGILSVRQRQSNSIYIVPDLCDIYSDMFVKRHDYYFFDNLWMFVNGERYTDAWVYLPIIEGDGQTMRPDDYMTWSEFVTFFIRLLSWDVYLYLEDDMTYPDSYLNMAEKIGWKIKKEGYVTFGEAYDFIYDVIQSPRIGFLAGFTIPIDIPYGVCNESMLKYRDIDLLYVYIQTKEQENQIKKDYDIDEAVELVGENVIIFSHTEYLDEEYKTWNTIVDAIVIGDLFEYKGDENGVPKEMISDGIIGYTEFYNKYKIE